MYRNKIYRLFFCALFLFIHSGIFSQEPAEVDNAQRILELNRVGIELSEQGEYAEAIQKFEEASRLEDRRGSISWHNLAYAFEQSGDRKKAMASYINALERNPDLLPSLQNLSRLEYLEGNYRESIQYGEKVLQIDPRNREVPRWLPDAYARAAEKRMFDLRNTDQPGEKENEEDYKPEMLDREYQIHVGMKVNPVFRFLKSSSALAIHTQGGPSVIPNDLYASLRLNNFFELRTSIGNPFFGLLQPAFMAGRQNIDYLIHHKSFYWGAGVQFTQLNLGKSAIPDRADFLENTAYSDLSDTKFGIELGSKGKDTLFRIRFFPRYLFRDSEGAAVQNRFDTADFLIEFRAMLDLFSKRDKNNVFSATPAEFYARFQTSELYITEYSRPSDSSTRSHWFGTYDIMVGMEFGSLKEKFDEIPFTIGFELAERLYFFDTGNTNLSGFGNSQGYFGFNLDSALTGTSFPGFRSNSHIFSFFSRQRFFTHWIFTQRLGLEFTRSAESVHGLLLELGVEARY